MENYLISVVVPVYKHGMPYLQQTCESILAQTYSNWECLLIINGNPSTGERECCAQFAARDARFKIFDFYDEPCNTGKAMNKGLELAQGKYITGCGHDDIYYPNFIQNLSQFLENNPDYSFVGSFVNIIDENNFVTNKVSYPTHHELMIENLIKLITPYHSFCIPVVIMRQFSGYLETSIGEDDDLIYKCAKLGKIANIPEYLYGYRKVMGRISASNSQNKFLNFINNINSAKNYLHDYKLPVDLTRRLDINYLFSFAEYEYEKIFVLTRLYQIYSFPTTSDLEKSEIKEFFNKIFSDEYLRGTIYKIIKQPRRSEFLWHLYRLALKFGNTHAIYTLFIHLPRENLRMIRFILRFIRKRLYFWTFTPPYLWGRVWRRLKKIL